MSHVTANGAIVFSGRMTFPRQGAGVLDLVVDNEDGITGACEVIIEGGLKLETTVVRGGAFLGKTRVRCVLGAGGLQKTARAQDYNGTSVRGILGDLARAGGERISSTSDQQTLAVTLPSYTVQARPIGKMISALLAGGRAGLASWRMLPDGTLWVGPEAWADSGLAEPDDYAEIANASELAAVDMGVDVLFPMPGTTIAGRRVSYTEVTIDGGAVRARVLFES